MKLGAFMEGNDPEPGVTSGEDPLDRYRRAVERHLGDKLVLLEEETFERFFDHVIKSFHRGVPSAVCAATWLHPSS
jgi:hypothetical protein